MLCSIIINIKINKVSSPHMFIKSMILGVYKVFQTFSWQIFHRKTTSSFLKCSGFLQGLFIGSFFLIWISSDACFVDPIWTSVISFLDRSLHGKHCKNDHKLISAVQWISSRSLFTASFFLMQISPDPYFVDSVETTMISFADWLEYETRLTGSWSLIEIPSYDSL